MLKLFCDKCGKEIEKGNLVGLVSLSVKDTAEFEVLSVEFDECHYCPQCVNAIRKFLKDNNEDYMAEQAGGG